MVDAKSREESRSPKNKFVVSLVLGENHNLSTTPQYLDTTPADWNNVTLSWRGIRKKTKNLKRVFERRF